MKRNLLGIPALENAQVQSDTSLQANIYLQEIVFFHFFKYQAEHCSLKIIKNDAVAIIFCVFQSSSKYNLF